MNKINFDNDNFKYDLTGAVIISATKHVKRSSNVTTYEFLAVIPPSTQVYVVSYNFSDNSFLVNCERSKVNATKLIADEYATRKLAQVQRVCARITNGSYHRQVKRNDRVTGFNSRVARVQFNGGWVEFAPAYTGRCSQRYADALRVVKHSGVLSRGRSLDVKQLLGLADSVRTTLGVVDVNFDYVNFDYVDDEFAVASGNVFVKLNGHFVHVNGFELLTNSSTWSAINAYARSIKKIIDQRVALVDDLRGGELDV